LKNITEYKYGKNNWKYLKDPIIVFGLFIISIPIVYFYQPSAAQGWVIMGFIFLTTFLSPNIILFLSYRANDLNKKVQIQANKSIQINSDQIDKNDILEIIIHRYYFFEYSTSPWKAVTYWDIRTKSGRTFTTTCLTVESDEIENLFEGLTSTVKSHFQSLAK
jgi:hypothetical protein